jgi:hypothetical protein
VLDNNLFFFFRCVKQIQQPEGCLEQFDGSCRIRQPQGFRVAVTVVLERLKRDEFKRKNTEPKK